MSGVLGRKRGGPSPERPRAGLGRAGAGPVPGLGGRKDTQSQERWEELPPLPLSAGFSGPCQLWPPSPAPWAGSSISPSSSICIPTRGGRVPASKRSVEMKGTVYVKCLEPCLAHGHCSVEMICFCCRSAEDTTPKCGLTCLHAAGPCLPGLAAVCPSEPRGSTCECPLDEGEQARCLNSLVLRHHIPPPERARQAGV